MIEVTNVYKSYGSQTVLNSATFQIQEGQLTTIVGPSGCGKTTMLRCLNRLEKFDKGSINVAGIQIIGTQDKKLSASEEKTLTQSLRSHVGIVFQNFNLFPHLTALENCTEALLTVKQIEKKKAEETAKHYMVTVGLSGKENLYPMQLSGGQQQRVAISRTLAMEPNIILFDEPTSALDPQLIQDLATLFRKLNDLRKTIIVVSHDMNFARRISDQIIYFEGGYAVEKGTPEEVFSNPKKTETIAFMQCFWE